ncbi:MAG: cysteine desulfurase, partial [Clostridia bacterium]|nr:cysteine desulfurase [Clostridia bacterium]
MIYLDHAATSPMTATVLRAQSELSAEAWGNPGGVYGAGRRARRALDEARAKLAGILGARPGEIFFTSGGTEADNWAIFETAQVFPDKRHLITTQIEHHAVLNPCRWLESQGWQVTWLKPDREGIVHPEQVREAIRPDTCLISVQMANNEIGTIEPIEEIGKVAWENGIRMHTDAVQAVGQIPVRLRKLPVDLLTLSGHKFGAPKGIGALYVRAGTRMEPFVHGGGQEKGMRSGTENAIGASLMALALEEYRKGDFEAMRGLRNHFIAALTEAFPDVTVNGSRKQRLPGNMHFSIPGIHADSLLMQLDLAGIAASAGSACTAGSLNPSHVISAIGGDEEAASLRLTLGHENTGEELSKV